MTDGASFRLVALRCPNCGGDLDGLDSDRVFGCRPCTRAWSVEPDGLRDSPLEAWTTREERPLYLPLWRFELEAVVVLPPRARVALPGGPAPAERIVPFPHPRAWITAFALQGRRRFGDPGLHLTRRAIEPPPAAPGTPPPLRGAVLTRAVAEQLLPATVLAVVDAREDVAGGRVELRVASATLTLVPFVRLPDGGVQEPGGGMTYPPAALPDRAALEG